MISRRKFVGNFGRACRGSGGLGLRIHGEELCADSRRQRSPEFCHQRPERPRLRASRLAMVANSKTARVAYICDVDSGILGKFAAEAEQKLGYAPKAETDFRHALESKDVDAITDCHSRPLAYADGGARPQGRQARLRREALQPESARGRAACCRAEEIWKARSGGRSAAVLRLHHPHDRSRFTMASSATPTWPSPGTRIRAAPWASASPRRCRLRSTGICGRARRRAASTRTTFIRITGTGCAVTAPARRSITARTRWTFADGRCRPRFPHAVTASGGRYQYKDDWQFPDTTITNFEYPDKLISWEGRSCQGMRLYDRDRGSVIMGTKGSVVIDRAGYDVFDWKGKQTDTYRTGHESSTGDLLSADSMTDASLCQLHRGHSRPAKTQLACRDCQCHRDHAAALEHRMVRQQALAG